MLRDWPKFVFKWGSKQWLQEEKRGNHGGKRPKLEEYQRGNMSLKIDEFTMPQALSLR